MIYKKIIKKYILYHNIWHFLKFTLIINRNLTQIHYGYDPLAINGLKKLENLKKL